MVRRPADYTAQLQADQERRRQQEEQRRKSDERRKRIQDRQSKAYGTAIIEVAGMRFDVDQVAGLVAEQLERADADPKLMEVWRQRGQAFFQKPANSKGRAGPASGDSPAGEQPAAGRGAAGGTRTKARPPRPEPGREATRRNPDMFGGLAPDRPGAHPTEEA